MKTFKVAIPYTIFFHGEHEEEPDECIACIDVPAANIEDVRELVDGVFTKLFEEALTLHALKNAPDSEDD